jgi:hypothetical protein
MTAMRTMRMRVLPAVAPLDVAMGLFVETSLPVNRTPRFATMAIRTILMNVLRIVCPLCVGTGFVVRIGCLGKRATRPVMMAMMSQRIAAWTIAP